MGPGNRFAPLIILAIAFVALQGLLSAADSRQTPVRTARAFIEGYCRLDEQMKDLLCEQLRNSGWAEDYLQAKADEAAQQGYPLSMFRHSFTHMQVATLSCSETTARVQVSGTTRVAVNPVFMSTGRLFGLGQEYPVNAVVDLIHQNGRWRVCGIRPSSSVIN